MSWEGWAEVRGERGEEGGGGWGGGGRLLEGGRTATYVCAQELDIGAAARGRARALFLLTERGAGQCLLISVLGYAR